MHTNKPYAVLQLLSCVLIMGLAGLKQLAQAGKISLHQQSTVEDRGLTFAVGPATRFGQTVNGRTHQQSPITTYRGYQYVTWFDAERRVCIGRRKLPAGAWEVIRFKDHHFKNNDAHNTSVLGICDTDGTIHMAFDHHASKLNYRVSKPGAAHHPESVHWDASLFSEIQHTLGSAKIEKNVTYPRFFPAPNGNLMFYYRSVTSGNGDGMIEEYNGDKHDWTPGLGKFIARDIDTFTAGGETSQYRCPYLNSISYAGKRLHVSWIWRDRFLKTNPINQHDLCYAYSDDDGRTWHNSDGGLIGETGKTFIHLTTPGLVVSQIPTHMGLTNQNTHYAYPDGSIHIMLLQKTAPDKKSVYHHHWRTRDGVWKYEALPFTGSRPKLVGSKDQTMILAYTAGNKLNLAKGILNADRTNWLWSVVKLPAPQSCYGEAVIDLERWDAEQILSVYGQESPSKIVRTDLKEPVDGLPSPIKVVDYRFVEKSSASR